MNLCKHYISINYILIKNLAWTLWPVLKLAQGKHENKQAAALAAAACSWRGRRQDNEWRGSGDKLQISASPAQPSQPSQPSPAQPRLISERWSKISRVVLHSGQAPHRPQHSRKILGSVRWSVGRPAGGHGLHHRHYRAGVPRAVHFVILIPS